MIGERIMVSFLYVISVLIITGNLGLLLVGCVSTNESQPVSVHEETMAKDVIKRIVLCLDRDDSYVEIRREYGEAKVTVYCYQR